ncbi:MAG TPA: biotin--[acetyl-CoA-carboxylase] ligase [Polyangiaceae bacterium]|nr:biotin--[acetyl-CoA-carboxylase] ligase [Polyangiaceae bacterium]
MSSPRDPGGPEAADGDDDAALAADLDPVRIENELARSAASWGRPLVVAPLTASTNDDAKRAARAGAPEGAAFVADAQSGGRGRLGRTWFSPSGENLYASFVLRPAFDPKRIPLVTLTAGLAVVDVVAPLVPNRHVGLKWPNDVFIDGRKVAGILSEAQVLEGIAAWVVIGIGINVRTTAFPPEIEAGATSLALAGASSLDRGALFVDLAGALFRRIEMLREGKVRDLVAAFAARDELAGQSITVDGAPATALGIADDGALVIRRTSGGDEKCVAGDVQLSLARRVVDP